MTCLHWVKGLNLSKGTTYRCGQLCGDQIGAEWHWNDCQICHGQRCSRSGIQPHLIYRYPLKDREKESNKLPELRVGKGERWAESINHVFTCFSFPHYCIYIRRHKVACLLWRADRDVQWYGMWTSLLTVFTYPWSGYIAGFSWGTKVSWLSLGWLYLSMHTTFTR